MSIMHFICLTAFILSLLGFAHHKKHLVTTLLCLESMTLTMFISLSMWPLQLQTPSMTLPPILVLTFSACDTSTGLALMVASSRTHGLDLLKNLNLLKC
uniref:NADH-ubiquinone oxidoreductase chain 4L n=1 Tax=Peltocephalus dumerilianus TaxID=329145 RepID=A0A1Z4EAW2_9SAUR|nr:NADH dehydrogenase subunit 4L [Peltocephalus dumerilianus]